MKKLNINMKKAKPVIISIAIGAAILGSAYAYKAYSEKKAALEIEKSEEIKASNAKDTDNLINEIGTVTIDSGKSITKAEKSYAKLSDDEKKLVKGYDSLLSARKEYDSLVSEKEEAESISSEIDKIGDVTIEKKEQIQSVSGRYAALSDFGKSYVKNYDTLKEKEDSLNKLIEEANAKLNDEVASEKKAEDEKSDGTKKTKKAASDDTEITAEDTASPKAVESAEKETESTVTDTYGNTVTIDKQTGAKTEDLGSELGTKTTYADGTIEYNDKNGKLTQNTDGTTRVEGPDGRYAVFDANGVIIDKNYEFDENSTLVIGN